MSWASRFRRAATSYVAVAAGFNRNVRLLLLASMLGGMAQGIFGVDFNLYILSLGMEPDTLGNILSAGPLAHALASIPIGFLSENFGFSKAFVGIYGLAGLSYIAQVATSDIRVIVMGAFVAGLAFSGSFVVQLPFIAANTDDTRRTHAFSYSSVISAMSAALGALVAGYLPNWLGRFTLDLSTSYRYTLYVAGALTLLAVLPSMLIHDESPRQRKKISLYPYLWGIDRFTVRVATVELFVGLTMGVIMPFMNVFYLYRLGTSREFFGNVSALAVVPIMIATTIGPVIAARLTDIGAVVAARWLIPVSTLVLAWTANPYAGTGAYWAYRALFSMSQSIWFAFVMETAAPRAKAAASAWLEITFWIGMAVAAQVTGRLLAEASYTLPFHIATASAVVTGVLTYLCARRCRALATLSEEAQRA
jgi:MFS family permease